MFKRCVTYFSGVVQSILPRPISNHYPVLLDKGGLRSGPSLFRFENMVVEGERLQRLVFLVVGVQLQWIL